MSPNIHLRKEEASVPNTESSEWKIKIAAKPLRTVKIGAPRSVAAISAMIEGIKITLAILSGSISRMNGVVLAKAKIRKRFLKEKEGRAVALTPMIKKPIGIIAKIKESGKIPIWA